MKNFRSSKLPYGYTDGFDLPDMMRDNSNKPLDIGFYVSSPILLEEKRRKQMETRVKLLEWERIRPKSGFDIVFKRPPMYLVHDLLAEDTSFEHYLEKYGTDYNQPFENHILTWDAMSTSLVHIDHPNRLFLGGSGVGYILDVPSQNILITGPSDLKFANNIGTTIKDGRRVLSDDVLMRRKFVDEILRRRKRPDQSIFDYGKYPMYEDILTPLQLLLASYKSMIRYSEVVIVGRLGVRIYEDMPPTDRIRLVGIQVSDKASADALTFARKLVEVNNVPLVKVKYN